MVICQEGKKRRWQRVQREGDCFLGWPRSIFWKTWLLNRDLNEVRKQSHTEHFSQREQCERKGQRWEPLGVFKEQQSVGAVGMVTGGSRRGRALSRGHD